VEVGVPHFALGRIEQLVHAVIIEATEVLGLLANFTDVAVFEFLDSFASF